MRGSIIDKLRKAKLEEDSNDNASGKQTQEILESSDVELPVQKPSAAERGKIEFSLTDTGIDNFVKKSLEVDKNATASEIVEALEKLHEDKNLKISDGQLSLIKSKIVNYSKSTSASVTAEEKNVDEGGSESSNVLKDMINNIPKIPGKIVGAYQRSRVINTAKQEYNKLRDKQDISATRKQSDILEDLKIFLRDNNYSSDEIRYEIENIVRPVKKLMKNSSGGLMSRS